MIEGQEERRLKAWDFVHCPPWTKHAFAGHSLSDDGLRDDLRRWLGQPSVGRLRVRRTLGPNDVAAKYDASVLKKTSKPDEAHARWRPEERTAYREGLLPG